MSINTVRWHIGNIFSKHDVYSRSDLKNIYCNVSQFLKPDVDFKRGVLSIVLKRDGNYVEVLLFRGNKIRKCRCLIDNSPYFPTSKIDFGDFMYSVSITYPVEMVATYAMSFLDHRDLAQKLIDALNKEVLSCHD